MGVMKLEGEKIKIMLIEDNPGDVRLIRELVAEADGAPFDLEHVDCLSKGLSRLEQGGIGVILLDLSLPDSHGLGGLGKILAQNQAMPIVVLSGLKDEAIAIKAVQGGAQDYLVKGSIDSGLLFHSLHYAIERQRLRVALNESEARYRLLADNIADVIWTADAEARITYVSPSIKQFLGYTVEEAMELKISDILTPDSTDQARRFIKWHIGLYARGSQPPPSSMTLEHIRKDGSTVWAEVILSFLKGKNGRITGIMGATRDVTERRKADEALRQSEIYFKALTENSSDGIVVLNTDGTVRYESPSFERLLGYKPEDRLGKSSFEFIHPDDILSAARLFEQLMQNTGSNITAEVRAKHKDGSLRVLEVMGKNLVNNAAVGGIVANFRDITESKKAAESLRESEERYRDLFENANDIIYVHDLDGNFVAANKAAEYVTGYTHEEIMKLNLARIVAPESIQLARQMIERKLHNGGSTRYELEIIAKDGHRIQLEVNTRLIFEDGKPVRVQGVARDITDRKKAEEALRESEERYRRLVDNAQDIVIRFSVDKGLEYVSPAVTAIMGYSPQELISDPELGFALATIKDEQLATDYQKVLTERLSLRSRELTAVSKDGRQIYLDMRSQAVRDKDGNVVAFEGILRDITERRKIEEELRLLSDAVRMSAESMFIAGIEGNVIDANEAALKMFGARDKSDLIGKGILNLIAPEDLEKAFERMKEVAEGKQVRPEEYHFIKKDGSRILIEISASILMEANGNPKGFVAMARDTTERKRMEDALRESEEKYRLYFENASDVIYSIDPEGKILSMSPAVERVLGYRAEELIGKNIFDSNLQTARSLELAISNLNRVFAGERGLPTEGEFIAKDGTVKLGEVSGAPVFSSDGKVMAVVCVGRDVTERKQMEEQLRLAGRLAAVGELAAGVAHELNNPIAAIQGFAQFLTARKDLDQNLRKDLDTIYRESQRAAKITQNLLSFARRHEPEKHFISINEAIEKTLELQANPMKVNNIELVVEFAPNLPKTMADFHQMQQVFINILNNAEQAMVQAHMKGKLIVKTQKVGSMIQISFTDNGPGISEENIKRIFDPFFTTKEVGKGTGLGLSICYGLVEAHGGRIYARSKLGQGATFVVEIPIVSEYQLVAESALLKLGSRGVKWKKQREQY